MYPRVSRKRPPPDLPRFSWMEIISPKNRALSLSRNDHTSQAILRTAAAVLCWRLATNSKPVADAFFKRMVRRFPITSRVGATCAMRFYRCAAPTLRRRLFISRASCTRERIISALVQCCYRSFLARTRLSNHEASLMRVKNCTCRSRESANRQFCL